VSQLSRNTTKNRGVSGNFLRILITQRKMIFNPIKNGILFNSIELELKCMQKKAARKLPFDIST
jgi:hypothetical protein